MDLTQGCSERLVKEMADWMRKVISNLGQQGLGEGESSRCQGLGLLSRKLFRANHVFGADDVPVFHNGTWK